MTGHQRGAATTDLQRPAGLADGTRVAVTRGSASPEEVAAVVVALDAARRERDLRGRPRPAPAWQRAARAEAVGGAPVSSPADLPR